MAEPDYASLHEAWCTEEPALAASHMTVEVVHAIAWRLVCAQIQPTVEAIRKVHGSGSPNIIHPALRSFFAGVMQARFAAPAPLPDIPAPLNELWRGLVATARERAASDLADQSAAVESLRTSLADDFKDAVEQAQADAEAQVQVKHEAMIRAEERANSLQASLDDACERLKNLGLRLTKAESVASEQTTRAATLASRLADTQLAADRDAKAAGEALAASAAEVDALRKALQAEVDTAMGRLRESEVRCERLAADLKAAATARDAVAAERDALTGRLAMQTERAAQAERALAAAEAAAASTTDTLSLARADLARERAARERDAALFADQLAAMRDAVQAASNELTKHPQALADALAGMRKDIHDLASRVERS